MQEYIDEYQIINHNFSQIISESLKGENLQVHAKAASFIDDFQLWLELLSDSYELVLYKEALSEYRTMLLFWCMGLYKHAFISLRNYFEAILFGVQLSTNELKKLRKEKLVSIASHTVSHTELNTLNTEQQLVEMANSRGLLNRSLKQNTILLIYPVGRYTPASPFIAQRAGYKFALTTKPGLANASQGLYELHRQRVIPNMSDESFNQLLSGN